MPNLMQVSVRSRTCFQDRYRVAATTMNPYTHLSFSALGLLLLLPFHTLCCQIEPLLVSILIQDQVLGCMAKSARNRRFSGM